MFRFVEENRELPSALRNLVAFYRSPEGAEKLVQWKRLVDPESHLLFAGMGTSEFTSEALACRLTLHGKPSRSIDAGEMFYQDSRCISPGTLIILTSQSGESVEIRNVAGLDRIGPYVAVTNDEQSSLAKRSALALPLHAGHEEAITTKTYTNNLALFRLMEAVLDGQTEAVRMLDALDEAADSMEELDEAGIEEAAENLVGPERQALALAFVGRGDALVTARQCGLTFMEGLKHPAFAYTGGAFRHGPFEAIGPSLGLILLRSSARIAALMDGLARDASNHGSPVAILDGCQPKTELGKVAIAIPRTRRSEAYGLFPLLAARSHNQLLHALATRLGIETGIFRYGEKITSKE